MFKKKSCGCCFGSEFDSIFQQTKNKSKFFIFVNTFVLLSYKTVEQEFVMCAGYCLFHVFCFLRFFFLYFLMIVRETIQLCNIQWVDGRFNFHNFAPFLKLKNQNRFFMNHTRTWYRTVSESCQRILTGLFGSTR